MNVAPVIPEFEYVTIRRTGGLLGVDESLHVGRDLSAAVTDRHRGDRSFSLDAITSQELMHSLASLVDRNPDPSSRRGCDLFHYDIELSYGGRVFHFNSVDLGADEALHGVMLAANRLIDADPAPSSVMRLRAE